MTYITDAAREYAKKLVKDNTKKDELKRLEAVGHEYANVFDNKIYPALTELYYIYTALVDSTAPVDEETFFDVVDSLDTLNLNLSGYVSDALDSPSEYRYDENDSKVEKYEKLIKTKEDIQKYVAPYIAKLIDGLKLLPVIFRKNGFDTPDKLSNAQIKHKYYLSFNLDRMLKPLYAIA